MGSDQKNPSSAEFRSHAAELVRELTGDLPCARCRYNLRGLSVRGTCPECGTPVRATLLAVVDPQASELRPVTYPLLTALGLQVWAISALLAALAVWLLRAEDLAHVLGFMSPSPGWLATHLPHTVPAFILLSGLGAIMLVRPQSRIARVRILAAAGACTAYLALVAVACRIHLVIDAWSPAVYFGTAAPAPERPILRLIADVLIAAIALGLRPNARLLVARSMLLRSGNVDRQTLVALAGSAGVAFVGDLVHVATDVIEPMNADVVRLIGTMFIGLGSMLVTIGLIGVVWDCLRLWPSVVAPPLSLDDVVGPRPE